MKKEYRAFMFYEDSTPPTWFVLSNKTHVRSEADALPYLAEMYEDYEMDLTAEDIERVYKHPFGGQSLEDRPIVFRGGWCYTVRAAAFKRAL